MADYNRYEVESLTEDRIKSVGRQVKAVRGPAQGARKERSSWAPAAMAFIALLSAGVVVSAVASLITVS
jgi:hypothetical protein